MLKIPLTILLSLVVFIILVGVLLMVFGSPKCDSLANSTAYYLKSSIDEVSQSSFYSWNNGGIPPDDQISYYKTAPIMLCQDKGLSYLEEILGTTLVPQYQIYYERFPEGGGGLWTEAYPWSGGAAASLRIWEYMRIATGVYYLSNAALLMRGAQYTGFMDWLGGMAHAIRLSVFGPAIQSVGPQVEEILVDELGDEAAKGLEHTSAYMIIAKIKGEEYLYTMQEALAEKIITGDTIGGKIIISNIPVDALILDPNSIVNGEPTRFLEVFQHTDSSGKLIGLSTDASKAYVGGDSTKGFNTGWGNLKVNPTDMYNDYYQTLSPQGQKIYDSVYITPDKITVGTIVKNGINKAITGTNFYQEFFQPMQDQLDEIINTVVNAGYEGAETVIPTGAEAGVKLGIIDAFNDQDLITRTLSDGTQIVKTKGDWLADYMLNQPGFGDQVKLALGMASGNQVKMAQLIKLFNNIDFKGVSILANDMEFGFEQAAINGAVNFAKDFPGSSIGSSFSMFESSFGVDPLSSEFDEMGKFTGTLTEDQASRFKVIQDFAKARGWTEKETISYAYHFVSYDVWPVYQIYGASDTATLEEKVLNRYLTYDSSDGLKQSLAARLSSDDESAAEQLGLLIGAAEQNKDTLPMNVVGYAKKTVIAESKKLVYLDGPQNILNPDSFYDRALFPSMSTAGCQGNSICLYSYAAAAESPLYLSSDSENYFVRIWRPVNVAEQWAGIQAALQHVPEDPRFYVVSPCLATAKIWKTTYNGKPTIFIYPKKVDTGGSSSNYCYADSNLINEYYAVWTGSDVATIITAITGFGVAGDAVKIISKVTAIADPITLTQAIIEGAISWPGWPFKPLTWDQMVANENKVGISAIQTGSTTGG